VAINDLAAAKALLRDSNITVEEAAQRVGVSPSTLYRHLPGGRGALIEDF
jgi:AcrR family transcriptional regulator